MQCLFPVVVRELKWRHFISYFVLQLLTLHFYKVSIYFTFKENRSNKECKISVKSAQCYKFSFHNINCFPMQISQMSVFPAQRIFYSALGAEHRRAANRCQQGSRDDPKPNICIGIILNIKTVSLAFKDQLFIYIFRSHSFYFLSGEHFNDKVKLKNGRLLRL